MCIVCYNSWLRKTNPEYKRKCAESSAKARNKPEGIRARNNSLLKQRYGITIDDRERMHAEQNAKCKICNLEKPLVVEHNHKTGNVRGLTCEKCNMMLGVLENNWKILHVAMSYLATEGKVV
jgi:hypothetical protein